MFLRILLELKKVKFCLLYHPICTAEPLKLACNMLLAPIKYVSLAFRWTWLSSHYGNLQSFDETEGALLRFAPKIFTFFGPRCAFTLSVYHKN